MQEFQQQFDERVGRIKNVGQFRDSDEMVKLVLAVGKQLFSQKMDIVGQDWLLRTGGELLGAFTYLGVKASEARAKRLVMEDLKETVYNRTIIAERATTKSITEARAVAKHIVEPLAIEQILLEHEENNFSHITKAAEKMISFIQSVLRQKNQEHFGGDFNNQIK